jgi:hypothetical protein
VLPEKREIDVLKEISIVKKNYVLLMVLVVSFAFGLVGCKWAELGETGVSPSPAETIIVTSSTVNKDTEITIKFTGLPSGARWVSASGWSQYSGNTLTLKGLSSAGTLYDVGRNRITFTTSIKNGKSAQAKTADGQISIVVAE